MSGSPGSTRWVDDATNAICSGFPVLEEDKQADNWSAA